VGIFRSYQKSFQNTNHKIFIEYISQNGNLLLSLSKEFKLRVIAKKILREFWEKHSDCEQQLKSWFQEADKGTWKSLNELKSEYPSASILEDNRVCFNIKGNNYRLIVKINFNYQMMWIRFIGTHAEYVKIDANKI
jgi:mRNA interferase HigB